MHAAYMARIMCVYNYKTNTVGGDLLLTALVLMKVTGNLAPISPFTGGASLSPTQTIVCVLMLCLAVQSYNFIGTISTTLSAGWGQGTSLICTSLIGTSFRQIGQSLLCFDTL